MPRLGEREQQVIVEPKQRTLQHCGERQIVPRQQQEPTKGHEIHDSQLIDQHHAIDAGDGNVARLERPHQFLDKAVATDQVRQLFRALALAGLSNAEVPSLEGEAP